MRAIMAAALISALLILALPLMLVVYRPAWTESEATATPAPVLPIEIINGELYIAIEVDGMPNESEE